jgi:hypothetical protein
MANLKTILLLTERDDLRNHMKPLAQWLDLHLPPQPIDALEHIKDHQPELFLVDAAALSPMVMALLTTIRMIPQYRDAPLIVLGDSPQAKRFKADAQFTGQFNLRRLEEKIAELLQIRLVGRGTHGPHHGSIY